MEIEMLGSTWTKEMPSEDLRAAEPSAKEDKTPKRVDSKFLQTFVLLGFGGALLARYYAFIGYIPEIDWKESLTYLSVLALSGTGLLALYGLLLFLPGVIWSELLVRDSQDQKLKCFSFSNAHDRLEACPVRVTRVIGIPFAVFLLIAHVPMIWGGEVGAVLMAGVAGLAPALLILGLFLNPELNGHAARLSLLTRYLLFFGLSALVSLVAMVILYSLLGDPSRSLSSSATYNDTRGLAMLAVCFLISIVANLAVALQCRESLTRAVVTGIVAAFLLFLAGESIPLGERTLSVRIMAQFGVGDKSEHTLFPNAEGIKLATRLHILPIAETKVGTGNAAGTASDEKTFSIPKVQILSGLGRAYYLEIESRRIVFPKDMVLAWESPVNAGKHL